MGYTHYYAADWKSEERQAAWPKLIQDASLIFEAADVLLCGFSNGHDNFVPPIADIDEGICFNGVAADGHEPFELVRSSSHFFIKTARKPYDLPVGCILLRTYLLAPSSFELRSDGSWDSLDWVNVRGLYQSLWPEEDVSCPWSERKDCSMFKERKPPSADNQQLATSSGVAKIDLTESWEESLCQIVEESQFCHRPQVSTVSHIDFRPIQKWLCYCEEAVDHVDCRPSPIMWQKFPGTQFKVIDLCQRCVVEAPENCSYFALSYVWGQVNQIQLNGTTQSILMNDGGLDIVWSRIPLVVQDAIMMCQALGERYLWVDAICIMQDSSRDMQIQISRMRQVYSGAKCVIAAVSSRHANVGLLGIAAVGNESSSVCDLPECTLDYLLESSPWNSRAWCYQEKVLSYRAILFTSNGIYMQCQKGTYSGDGAQIAKRSSHDQFKADTIGALLYIPQEQGLGSYLDAVECYSQRQLTREEDRLNA